MEREGFYKVGKINNSNKLKGKINNKTKIEKNRKRPMDEAKKS